MNNFDMMAISPVLGLSQILTDPEQNEAFEKGLDTITEIVDQTRGSIAFAATVPFLLDGPQPLPQAVKDFVDKADPNSIAAVAIAGGTLLCMGLIGYVFHKLTSDSRPKKTSGTNSPKRSALGTTGFLDCGDGLTPEQFADKQEIARLSREGY